MAQRTATTVAVVVLVIMSGSVAPFVSLGAIGAIAIEVVDEDGNPIEGATVTAEADGSTVETGDDGEAEFRGLSNGNQDFSAEANGYESSTVAFNLNQVDSGTITLTEKELGGGGGPVKPGDTDNRAMPF